MGPPVSPSILIAFFFFLAYIVFPAMAILLTATACRIYIKSYSGAKGNKHAVAFFHPSAGAGGGGERVLWVALKALQCYDLEHGIKRRYLLYSKPYLLNKFRNDINPKEQNLKNEKAQIEKYENALKDKHNKGQNEKSNKNKTPHLESLLELVKEQFGIVLPAPIELVLISEESFATLNPKKYPYFTILLQTLVGGWYMFLEATCTHPWGPPGVLIDTVGIPFMYPLMSYCCDTTVITYTHYPSISSDMINRVSTKITDVNNDTRTTSNSLKTHIKLIYYYLFSWVYWFCGRFTTVVMTNSSWTQGHVARMWGARTRPQIVFPPCNVLYLLTASEEAEKVEENRKNIIMSLGQFRPEKNQALQLRAFSRAFPQLPQDSQLFIVGGARDKGDLARVDELKKLAGALPHLELDKNVKILVSIPYSQVLELLQESTVGLHTMRDEHFGICVVEFMAAGALALSHNSAGPKMDIVGIQGERGLLAGTEEQFAAGMVKLMNMSEEEKKDMRKTARNWVREKFSDEAFGKEFVKCVWGALSVPMPTAASIENSKKNI